MKMKTLRVGVLGMGWMGHAHARSWLALEQFYPELKLRAKLTACADTDKTRRDDAKQRYGFERGFADWREMVKTGGIDILSVTAPNNMHLEIIQTAARAGMHIYCEKPAGRDENETRRAHLAAKKAGVLSCVGYNYRYAPMARYCRDLIKKNKFGALEQLNCRFLSMYGSDPMARLSWRYDKKTAGAGASGDMLSHAADMAVYLGGGVREVSAHKKLFIAKRPLPQSGKGTHFSAGKKSDPHGKVTNEDYIGALARFESGAIGFLESSRVARGPKCEMAFELYGEKGSARWNFENMNALNLYLPGNSAEHDGYATLLAGAAHPQHGRFNPGDGIGAGYEDLKKMEAAEFAVEVSRGKQKQSGLLQAAQTSAIVGAALRSCDSGKWEKPAKL